MPPQTPFDPIAAYRQQYQGDTRSDSEIANKLLDPANFRKAFPQYDYSTPDADSRIKAHMTSFISTKFPSTPSPAQPQSEGALSYIEDQAKKILPAAKEWIVDPLTQPYKEGYRDPINYATRLGQGLWDMHFGQMQPSEVLRGDVPTPQDGQYGKFVAAASQFRANPNVGTGINTLTQAAGNFLIIGPAAVNVGEDVQQGQYGKAIGHAGALIFGGELHDAITSPVKSGAARIAEHYSDPHAEGPAPSATTSSTRQAPVTQPRMVQTMDGMQPVPTPKGPTSLSDFQGQDGPMRPYDPQGTRFARGGTVGMDPLQVDKLQPQAQSSLQVSTDSMGIRWATDPKTGYKVSVPKRIQDADIESYATPELQKQVDTHAAIKAQIIDKGVDDATSRVASKGSPSQTRNAVPEDMPQPSPINPQEARDLSAKLGYNVSTDQVNQVLREQAAAADVADKLQGNRGDATGDIREAKRSDLDKQYREQTSVPVGDAQVAPAQLKTPPANEAPTTGPVEAGQPKPLGMTPRVRVAPDLPAPLQRSLDTMVKLKSQIDSATPELKTDLNEAWLAESNRSKALLKQHLSNLDPDGLAQLKEKMGNEKSMTDAQAGAIREMVKSDKQNKPIVKTLREMMSSGGTQVRAALDNEGNVLRDENDKVQGGRQEAEVKRGGRDLFHELMGEKPFTTPEQLERHEMPKKPGVTQEGWDKLGEKLQSQRMALRMEIARDFEIARDTQLPIDDTDIPDKMRRLQDVEKMYGKYPTVSPDQSLTGRRTKLPVTIGEKGELIAKEPLATISLAKARAVMGTKVNKIPTHEEFLDKANELNERGRLRSAISSVIDKLLDQKAPAGSKEAGVVGELKQRSYKPASPDVMSGPNLVKEAQKNDRVAWAVTEENPSGGKGWMSPDGKHFIDSGMLDHDDIAREVLRNVQSDYPRKTMLDSGWIRKHSLSDYEVGKPTSKAVDAIEMDLLRNGKHGQELRIDAQGPRGIKTLTMERGWEDLGSEVRKQLADPSWKSERGVAPAINMGSAALGGAIGMKLGGPIGGAIGFATGFVAPSVLTSSAVRSAMGKVAPMVRAAGLPLRQWFNGVPQSPFSVGTKMDAILKDQAEHSTFAGPKLVERLTALPANIYKGFDRFALVNGGTGAVGRLMMSIDPRGRAFRDLSKPDNQALYIAAREAGKQIKGLRADAGIEFAGIMKDAMDQKMGPQFKQYLNLKAYQRTYDVINEHKSDLQAQEQNITTKMQSPSITSRQMVALQDDLRDVKKAQTELDDKLRTAKVVPQNYTPTEIAGGIQQLEGQFPTVKGLADRVFQQNRKVLDMVHDEGIISDENYQKFTARGDAYIPMSRIMDDLEKPQAQAGQSSSPLYLRHQSVIQGLEGSERTNVDPLEASSNHNARGFSQVIRNRVMNDALDLVQAYPQQLSGEFKPVSPDYRAKVGEGIVGVYKDGQPSLFAVPKYLHETLEGAPLQTKTAMGVLARYASEKFREGATVANIAFTIPSVFSHATSSLFLSETGLSARPDIVKQLVDFSRDWGKSVKSVLNQDQTWREMVRSGAAFSTAQRMITPEYFTNPSELGFKQKLAKGRILDAMKDVNAAAEDINKLTTFNRMRRAGASEKQAAWETSNFGGAPDFSRTGDFSQGMNLALMFFNANLQYMHQAFTGIQRNPGRVLSLMAGLTGLALAANSWNSQQKDSQGNDLLRKVSPDERARNFVVLTGDTYTNHNGAEMPYKLLIPKPPIARYIYNPIENIVNYAGGKETRTGQQQVLDTISNYVPGRAHLEAGAPVQSAVQSMVASANPIAKIGIEQYANKNDFGQPLVPGTLQKVDPQFQTLPSTSTTADQMGQGGRRGAEAGAVWGSLFGSSIGGYPGAAAGAAVGAVYGAQGVSPIRSDNIMRNIGGGLSQGVTAMTDPFFGGGMNKPALSGPEALRKTPIVGAIASRFAGGSSVDQQLVEQTQKFYDNAQKLETVKNTANMLFKQDPKAAEKYINDHKDDFFRASLAQSMAKSLGSFSGLMKQVQGDQSMSPADKDKTIRQLYDARMKMLREFNQAIEKR